MDNELDTVSATETDFQESRCSVGADQHREVVESENSDRVLICVENVLISDAVLSGTVEDDRIHGYQVILITIVCQSTALQVGNNAPLASTNACRGASAANNS